MKQYQISAEIVAERNGIALGKRHTRFRTIEYFVEDRTGVPSIVYQYGDIYEAVKAFRKLSDSAAQSYWCPRANYLEP